MRQPNGQLPVEVLGALQLAFGHFLYLHVRSVAVASGPCELRLRPRLDLWVSLAEGRTPRSLPSADIEHSVQANPDLLSGSTRFQDGLFPRSCTNSNSVIGLVEEGGGIGVGTADVQVR